MLALTGNGGMLFGGWPASESIALSRGVEPAPSQRSEHRSASEMRGVVNECNTA